MQKRLHFAVLVKGLFLTGKKIFPVGFSPRPNKSRAFLPHRSNRGAGLTFSPSADLIGQFGGLPSGNLPPTSTLKIE